MGAWVPWVGATVDGWGDDEPALNNDADALAVAEGVGGDVREADIDIEEAGAVVEVRGGIGGRGDTGEAGSAEGG